MLEPEYYFTKIRSLILLYFEKQQYLKKSFSGLILAQEEPVLTFFHLLAVTSIPYYVCLCLLVDRSIKKDKCGYDHRKLVYLCIYDFV